MPVVSAVTTPDDDTETTVQPPLLQLPPDGVAFKVVVEPMPHIIVLPGVIAGASTVTVTVAIQPDGSV